MAKLQFQRSKDSISKRRIQKLLANKLAVFGFFLFMVVVVMCICAPLLTDQDPTYIDMRLRYAPPSAEHPFGCDQSGRDIFSRILYGGRVSMAIALVSAICTNLLGSALGCIAGYYGGKVDQVLMYISEIFRCFPNTMLVLIIMGMSGEGIMVMILVFIFTGWIGTMRLVRSRVLSLKQEVFVENLKASGVSGASIMFKHILPNAIGIFILNITSQVAGFILSESSLSFLGVGVPKGTPTWGNMLNAARAFNVMQRYPNVWVIPGIAIALFVLGVNFFGDGLRDVFDVSEE